MKSSTLCERNGGSGFSTREILGLPVHAARMNEVVDFLDRRITQREPVLVGVVNAAKLVNMRRDVMLDHSVRRADLVLADGMSIVWASRLLLRPLPERVTGFDLMQQLLELSHRRGYRVFCLGATEAVLESAMARMREQYPSAVIAGWHHGYFSSQEEADVAERIRLARPDILLVAMTSPKKERFLARWSPELKIPVCHGVGGSFDVWAGKVRRAPVMWQRLGLEWLYRVAQEPRRLWKRYLVTNSVFVMLVLRSLFWDGRRGKAEARI